MTRKNPFLLRKTPSWRYKTSRTSFYVLRQKNGKNFILFIGPANKNTNIHINKQYFHSICSGRTLQNKLKQEIPRKMSSAQQYRYNAYDF